MSYNPEYFKNMRPSERLLESAKSSLDELGNGYSHLKKDLEKSLFDGEPQQKIKIDPSSLIKKQGHGTDTLC
jgi:hypothetical protein